MPDFLRSKYRLLAVTATALLLGIGAVQGSRQVAAPVAKPAAERPAPQTDEVTIDLEGAVAVPGVRHMTKGSLVEDAISQAGGLTEQADQAKVAQTVNRSDVLKDHQKLYIPATGESVSSGTGAAADASAPGPVNLNDGTAAELDTLPGVGPGTSKKIIDYRTKNGPFAAPEDVQNVPGMTAKKFDQIKDLVTV